MDFIDGYHNVVEYMACFIALNVVLNYIKFILWCDYFQFSQFNYFYNFPTEIRLPLMNLSHL